MNRFTTPRALTLIVPSSLTVLAALAVASVLQGRIDVAATLLSLMAVVPACAAASLWSRTARDPGDRASNRAAAAHSGMAAELMGASTFLPHVTSIEWAIVVLVASVALAIAIAASTIGATSPDAS